MTPTIGTTEVKLEIIADKDTGFTFHYFSWEKDGRYHGICEIGNSVFINADGKAQAHPYSEADRAMAENNRMAIQDGVNNESQGG